MPAKNKLIRGVGEERYVEALRDIKQILDEADVKYWLDFGTLLGAVRDGKFIPWDNDIDLGTLPTESHKIIAKIPQFEQKGLVTDVTDHGIYLVRGPVSTSIHLTRLRGEYAWKLWGPYTESKFHRVTRYFVVLGDRILYRNLLGRTKMPLREKIAFALIPSFADDIVRRLSFRIGERLGEKHYALVVPRSNYENLDSISFYGMTFNIPSHVHDYLSLYYGENWMNPDQNWAYSQYPAIDYNFDIGRKQDLSVFN